LDRARGSSVCLGLLVLPLPLVRDARRRCLARHVVHPRARTRRADLPVHPGVRRGRARACRAATEASSVARVPPAARLGRAAHRRYGEAEHPPTETKPAEVLALPPVNEEAPGGASSLAES